MISVGLTAGPASASPGATRSPAAHVNQIPVAHVRKSPVTHLRPLTIAQARTGSAGANVRTLPSTIGDIITHLAPNTVFNIGCYEPGEVVNGNNEWFYAEDYGGFISGSTSKIVSGNPFFICDF
jgi:hypothetical protein